jgi:energy-coupling factor transport system permease protein
MSAPVLSYIKRDTPVHSLSGATKIIVFLLWSILAMVGYDTRIMCVMTITAFISFRLAKIKLKEVRVLLLFMGFFLIVNLIMVYVFSPEHGVSLYGTRHVLLEGKGRFTLTAEQLFYELNIFLKYITMFPMALLVILTIHPSEFAASLNRVGVPYTIAYAVSITFRYIPDIQRDFTNIYQVQQARGIELSKKQSLLKRLKGIAAILLPLLFSSIDRIDVVSRAMELRSFGKYTKRTWYNYRPFRKRDIAVLVIAALFFALSMWFTFRDGSRFFNPFE